MKIVLVILLFITLSSVLALKAESQERYLFECVDVKYPKTKLYHGKDTFFSDSINSKLALFNEIYTKKVDRDPKRYVVCTEISKPDLYYSVQRLSKYYFKCLKKGIISPEKVESEFASILDKGIRIYPKETNMIEAELRTANNPQEIMDVFDKIVIKQSQM